MPETTWKPRTEQGGEENAIDVAEDSWHDLGKKPHTDNPSH